MNQYIRDDLLIQVFDDPTFLLDSVDNKSYQYKYFSNDYYVNPASKHGIKVFINQKEVASCILIGNVGATRIHATASCLDNDALLVCCSDTVFSLTVPDLNLRWRTKTDQVTCFQILGLQDSYIVHGEVAISRIDKNGGILWQFSGKDIFTKPDGKPEVEMKEKCIIVTDWSNHRYVLDFDGKELTYQ